MDTNLHNFLVWLSLPTVGLPAVFSISFVSATLLPLGSEPVLFGYIKLNPEMFWPAVFVATAGNTLGGMLNWLMGYGASKAHEKLLGPRDHKLLGWFEKLGPPALLLSWLPIVGDPSLCGCRLAQVAMAFMHDLHGYRQVFTLCHHDLRFIVDSS
jgi:membrane protein YqaA with SNARE-associated domain